MAKDKLGREALEELRELHKAHAYFKHATRALELYNNLWKSQRITEKGLDREKNYEINLETGIIREAPKVEIPEITEDGTKGN